ncbi:hypothetical protein NQ318_006932 [Aromia moschata]|uniref:RNA polymerase alpha subunit n=1 Tax=Aromia moschata TaxID=1265417 RepID=A0AAV8YLM1_9CUCU|nr:hypothetical protein NQ318_006932 [Aromia moschata]
MMGNGVIHPIELSVTFYFTPVNRARKGVIICARGLANSENATKIIFLTKCLQSLRSNWIFSPKSNHGTTKTITVDEAVILIRVSQNPGLSTRRLSTTTGLSQSSICRILEKEVLHHYTTIQQLFHQDLPDIFNVNICCGVISNFVIGPFELPPNLTGPRTARLKRKRGLCTTERHHILPCQYANICMSIFVIGGLAVEDLVYQEEVHSLQELRQRIQEAANTVKNNIEKFCLTFRDI